MAEQTPVNPQITDAVTQANVKTLGETPAQAMGELYQESEEADSGTNPSAQQTKQASA